MRVSSISVHRSLPPKPGMTSLVRRASAAHRKVTLYSLSNSGLAAGLAGRAAVLFYMDEGAFLSDVERCLLLEVALFFAPFLWPPISPICLILLALDVYYSPFHFMDATSRSRRIADTICAGTF